MSIRDETIDVSGLPVTKDPAWHKDSDGLYPWQCRSMVGLTQGLSETQALRRLKYKIITPIISDIRALLDSVLNTHLLIVQNRGNVRLRDDVQ